MERMGWVVRPGKTCSVSEPLCFLSLGLVLILEEVSLTVFSISSEFLSSYLTSLVIYIFFLHSSIPYEFWFFYILSGIISLQLSNFHCICVYVLFSLSIFSYFWTRGILHCHVRLLVRVFVSSSLKSSSWIHSSVLFPLYDLLIYHFITCFCFFPRVSAISLLTP